MSTQKWIINLQQRHALETWLSRTKLMREGQPPIIFLKEETPTHAQYESGRFRPVEQPSQGDLAPIIIYVSRGAFNVTGDEPLLSEVMETFLASQH